MCIDVETMLDRGDFSHPLFAEFILDKYEDIKKTDPDSGKKIEERVFTPEFLKTVLAGESPGLKIRAFRQVPPACFSGLGKEIQACMSDPRIPGGIPAAAGVLKVADPDGFRSKAIEIFEADLEKKGMSAPSFPWLGFFHDLPCDLQKNFFDRSAALIMADPELFSSDGGNDRTLVRCLEAALCLKDVRRAGLAAKMAGAMVAAYDPEDSGYYQFCFDLFRFLTPVPDDDRTDFELDLFFHLENGNVDRIPAVADQFYAPGPDGVSFSTALEGFQERVADPVAWLTFEIGERKTLAAEMFGEILKDPELMAAVGKNGLAFGLASVFLCLEWQERRSAEFSPEEMSNSDLVEYLILDTRDLPFMEQVRSFVKNMDEVRRAEVLIRAMDRGLTRWNNKGTGFYSLVNILRFMSEAAEADYLPLVLQSLRWPVEEEDDDFYEDILDGLCRFGEQVFDALDPVMEEIREERLLDILSLIRRSPGPRAEDFLFAHLDRFMETFRADTLDALRMLASRRGLDLVGHKVGKAQPGVDELFVIVNTFEGNDGPEVRKTLETIASAQEELRERFELVEKNLPRDVMKLELKCALCGDKSFYDCRNILVTPRGEGYVAEELSCISCGRISEFDISDRGRWALQAEMMRVFGRGEEEDEMPVPGAVKIMNSAFFGRTMSIGEGISLYKEKIRKEPKNPSHYIALGNAYRSVSQESLARVQYEKAVEVGPFYIEAYLGLARMDETAGAHESALDWLEKGRPYLKRPLICRGMQEPADQIMEGYRDLHFELVRKTKRNVAMIRDSECMTASSSLKKIGPNEKCPCGSGKKYKKCCKRKQ